MDEKEKLEKAIRQAAASIWLEGLPLSKDFIEDYKLKRMKEFNNKSLILRRGGSNAKLGRRK